MSNMCYVIRIGVSARLQGLALPDFATATHISIPYMDPLRISILEGNILQTSTDQNRSCPILLQVRLCINLHPDDFNFRGATAP